MVGYNKLVALICAEADCPAKRLRMQSRGYSPINVDCGKCGRRFEWVDSPPVWLNPVYLGIVLRAIGVKNWVRKEWEAWMLEWGNEQNRQ